MLGLKLPTDPRWVSLAEKSLEDILTDHAYCEQKAASQCMSLIQQYPERKILVQSLAPIVSEEWSHFRMVLKKMEELGLSLGPQRKDEYVNRLLAAEDKSGSRDERLVEKLLICALIEARSCERFRLLSTELENEDLRSFYHEFMVSEAGHYRLFQDLAREYSSEEEVKDRWTNWLKIEAKIVEHLVPKGDRVH